MFALTRFDVALNAWCKPPRPFCEFILTQKHVERYLLKQSESARLTLPFRLFHPYVVFRVIAPGAPFLTGLWRIVMLRFVTLLAAASFAFAIAGCSAASTDGYKGPVGKVSGTITFDGSPIPQGSQVMFQAVSAGYTAIAVVDAGGNYVLKYNGSVNIPAVKYLVQIAPPVEPQEPIDPSNMERPSFDGRAAMFPGHYRSTASSQLDCSVAEGVNTKDFILEARKNVTGKRRK